MKMLVLLFILNFKLVAQAADYKVLFKSEATDKRANIVEPDIIFLENNDRVIFSASNVDLTKIVVIQVNRDGQFAEVDANSYRDIVDKSYLITKENYIYLYYSTQYYSTGALGISIVGSLYQKQADALRNMNYNQNFKDRIAHIMDNLTPVDAPEPASGTTTTGP